LQEREFERLGSNKTQHIDVRVIAATNRDLRVALEDGTFREDLYYRLNVIEVKVPALRERGADLALLVRHFLLKFGRSAAGDALPLSPDAWAALQGYAFPGNVRELENILERACTLCESGVIGVDDLQLPSAPTSPAFGELQEWLDHLERDRILAAIAQTGGNKTKAARVLGISFRALRYRLTRLGIGSD
jgi:DNA-binding NtrC family response regulator